MKIGDKVLVTYSDGDQFAGRIYGETPKSWKIEFDDGTTRTVRKTTTMEVIDDPEAVVEEPVEEVVEETDPYEPTKYEPSKKLKRKNVLILLIILLGAAAVAAALLYGIGII